MINLNPNIGLVLVKIFLIWSILARSNQPGDFPKIVSNRITHVKPINVGFQDSFLFFQSQASSRNNQIK